MKARINITTPAGKSLEGFPIERNLEERVYVVTEDLYLHLSRRTKPVSVHEGDTITIEILLD